MFVNHVCDSSRNIEVELSLLLRGKISSWKVFIFSKHFVFDLFSLMQQFGPDIFFLLCGEETMEFVTYFLWLHNYVIRISLRQLIHVVWLY